MIDLINNRTTIDFNITNYCNSKCPTCKRFSSDHEGPLKLAKGLKLMHMNVNDFKSCLYFNEDFFKNKTCQFCGEFGDPFVHPKFEEFISTSSYFFDEIFINTNGGVSRKKLFNNIIEKYQKANIVFSIDGITHDINSKYRQGVNTDLALSNMINFSKNTQTRTYWDYIIFKHNIFQLEDAIVLAIDNNIKIYVKINLREWGEHRGVGKISFKEYLKVKEIVAKYKQNNFKHIKFHDYYE